MEGYIARRSLLKRKITRIETKMEEEDIQQWDIDTATIYNDKLNEIWNEFNSLFDDILSSCPATEEEQHELQYTEIANRIDRRQVALKQLMRRLQGAMQQPQQQHQREVRNEVNVKLPKFDLPKFSGNVLEWTTFQDLFASSVHNHPTLPGAEKLKYLKMNLTGEAAELLESFSISDANYLEAWDTLQKRYQNKRKIVKAHLTRFLEQPYLKAESGQELRKLVDTSSSVVRALKALERPIHEDCDLAMHIIASRLDPETNKLWETHLGRDSYPKLKDLLDYLDDRAAVLNASSSGNSKVAAQSKVDGAAAISAKGVATAHHSSTTKTCTVCKKEDHPAYACPVFTAASVADRRAKVAEFSLCFNCLRTGHISQNCHSEVTCKKCKQKHHTMLHFDHAPSNSSAHPDPSGASAHTSVHEGDSKRALLATAVVTVRDAFGQAQLYRALIDPGADVSFATERCVQSLGLKKQKTDLSFSGLGASSLGKSKSIVHMTIGSRFDAETCIDVDAYVLPRVTGTLPKMPISPEETSHLNGIPLADPAFHNPGAVDLLLGSDVFFSNVKSGQINVSSDRPVALETTFGWIVGGACKSQNISTASVHHIRCESKLDDILEKFWLIEEIPTRRILTKEEKECEDHFINTTTRDAAGRFIVELPFRRNAPPLGASRDMAIKRLKQVERSLQHKPDLKLQYIDFMEEYMKLGHMELVPEEEMKRPDQEVCYLPHHAIIKESSSTTKVRVVFDGSAKTSSGRSLNDNLLPGPKLQDDLFVTVIRFREWIIAFTADICKMFRQIWIAIKHRNFQRIVWRKSPDQPIKDYWLTTVTYGSSSAPYLAKRCLQLLAEISRTDYPFASPVAVRDFYMDDLMSGHFSPDLAQTIQREMMQMMRSAGMELRKWSSNDEQFLQSLSPEVREMQLPLRIDEDDTIKTLGLFWVPASDIFWFKVTLPPMRRLITKRTISSDSARIFDPLGFLGPVTILVKMLMQSLWALKLEWDEPVPEHVRDEWTTYRENLPQLENIKIPRCLKPNHDCTYELIGFSDASEKATAAVVYLRSKSKSGEYMLRIVASKTKVAPLKQISLPRLELSAALMLVRLMQVISESFVEKPEAMYAFTDSTVVLAWLSKHPKKWDTFVANRVALIQDFLGFEFWYHVPGMENPADCASRGIKPSELCEHTLWWQGPEWLKDSSLFTKPTEETLLNQEMVFAEARREVTIHHITHDLTILNNFSTFSRLQRVTAYCRRFINNCKSGRKNKDTSFLKSGELQLALHCWVRLVQGNCFAEEIQSCLANEPVSVKSRLRSLSPFLDDQGILRVGGRLRHAKLSLDRRNPMILPGNHSLTSLIIHHEHCITLHGGTQLVLANIQRKFWIVNGRDIVRRLIRKCVVCTRFRAETATQMMSDLPSVRVNLSRAFLKVGVDFAGPFTLRVLKGRGNRHYKAYTCIFICMVTKAVHLELVTGLSSEAFIATLERFISRRGKPADIYSDCGRNFVGADKELRRRWKLTEFQNEIGSFLATKVINWHFNPPSSPHFGGLWEAGLKSMKHHLLRVMGTCIFNYEDMYTILTRIEACLNSRPLTQLSSDPNDLSPLTPGHFLVFDALTAIPEQNWTTEPTSHLSKWKQMQRVVQHFWKRWSAEYLTRLQQRPKWLTPRRPIRTGDLVLVKDERLPPLKWKLARVLEGHPGADGLTRVYTVKTDTGTLKRPLVKLCPLPHDADD